MEPKGRSRHSCLHTMWNSDRKRKQPKHCNRCERLVHGAGANRSVEHCSQGRGRYVSENVSQAKLSHPASGSDRNPPTARNDRLLLRLGHRSPRCMCCCAPGIARQNIRRHHLMSNEDLSEKLGPPLLSPGSAPRPDRKPNKRRNGLDGRSPAQFHVEVPGADRSTHVVLALQLGHLQRDAIEVFHQDVGRVGSLGEVDASVTLQYMKLPMTHQTILSSAPAAGIFRPALHKIPLKGHEEPLRIRVVRIPRGNLMQHHHNTTGSAQTDHVAHAPSTHGLPSLMTATRS